MKKRLFSVLLILAMVCSMLPIAASAAEAPPDLKNISYQGWEVLRLTNIERAKEGLPLLVTFDEMQKYASIRGMELIQDYRSDHTRPDGRSFETVFDDYDFSYSTAAENIAGGQPAASMAMESWMDSPTHKANILDAGLRYMGVGNGIDGAYNCWVQLFATSSGSDCKSITYNEAGAYFTLELQNGITAYAPYDPASSPTVDGTVTFNYPGSTMVDTETPELPELPDTAGMEGGYFLDQWLYILAYEGSAIYDQGGSRPIVASAWNKTPIYMEHLGDHTYYIKTQDGEYLAPAQDVLATSQQQIDLTLTTSPYEWGVSRTLTLDGVLSYYFYPESNSSYVLRSCPTENDGMVYLSYSSPSMALSSKCYFTVDYVEDDTQASDGPFTDVPVGSFYEDAVLWAVEREITTGTSDTTFSPDATLTRGQVVTFLWRTLETAPEADTSGFDNQWFDSSLLAPPEPTVYTDNPFTDVPAGSYFEQPVLWAVDQGITNGTTATTFSPDQTCTHAEALTFLYRALGSPIDFEASVVWREYKDFFFGESLAWAQEFKLINTYGGEFFPDAKASRADTIFYLYQATQ